MELRPIIVDGNGKIIGGNQRYKACLAIGKKEIPTSWVLTRSDLTPSQKRRFVLIDNSPDGISGRWDYPILQKDYTQPELMDLGFEIDEQAAQFAGIKCRSLKPYTMVHVLISASIKRIDVIQKVLDKLEGIEGVEIEKSAN